TKIGVKTALINSNLSGAGLAHCVNVADASVLVMNSDQAELMHTARDNFPGALQVWTLGEPVQGALDMGAVLASQSDVRPDRSHRAGIKAGEVALYVYTSGTTGLPKAARITHARGQGMMRSFIPTCDVVSSDRIYLTLPLYHSTGGLCGVGCAMNTGAAIILRRKFSATQFWPEAKATGANMIVYIGELGRYLMNNQPGPEERDHSVVKGFGNGLRADVWTEFVERTGVKQLVEFYGSTEGNVSFVNVDGTIGAVGRIPPILKKQFPIKIVKFDTVAEEPIRDENGWCIEADFDEVGEVVGEIKSDVMRARFEGYKDAEQTKKKVLSDAFAEGDRWFRTGDLMKRDKHGYFYFIDRIGDTFRWKSENVSTNEVGDVVGAFDQIAHANVYGVEVPGSDGRAGMAAVTVAGELDLPGLHAHLQRELPSYARPLFLRIQRSEDTTGTFKYRKVELVKEGFDPAQTEDEIYYNDLENGEFKLMNADLFAQFSAQSVRV
ncbi:MAG: AMP-binding protein, partial [Pseudomonadota bacterium]